MKSNKILLLDIDHTLIDNKTPRPYLKEFMERMNEKFIVRFYTAASFSRVTEVCRILYYDLKMDKDFVRELQMYSLFRENCPMIQFRTKNGGTIDIKCLEKASKELNSPIENLLLLDDNPMSGSPYEHQTIQAEGFMAWDVDSDDYLKRLDINEDQFLTLPDIDFKI